MQTGEEIFFTLEEARQALPGLKTQVLNLRELKRSMELKAPEIAGLAERGRENAGSSVGTEYLFELLEFRNRLYQFAKTGCILRDIDRGLLDFPYLKGTRKVYLCWAWGEETIRWWHDVDSGFAGRQPL